MSIAALIIGANEVGPTNEGRKNYHNQIYASAPLSSSNTLFSIGSEPYQFHLNPKCHSQVYVPNANVTTIKRSATYSFHHKDHIKGFRYE
jgi:hypothetical protein